MTAPAVSTTLTRAAFATLLLIALMMGGNHVAARLAFDHGVDVATAVMFRSGVTALVVGGLLVLQRVPWRLDARERRVLLAMPAMLAGLALALDVFGAASGLGASAQWGRIGAEVAFAVGAAAIFGLALVLAWALLGQAIAPVQVLGGLIVVAMVVWLGLRRMR